MFFNRTETPQGLSFRWEGELRGGGGSGFWTGARAAECPTVADAGATHSLAVPG